VADPISACARKPKKRPATHGFPRARHVSVDGRRWRMYEIVATKRKLLFSSINEDGTLSWRFDFYGQLAGVERAGCPPARSATSISIRSCALFVRSLRRSRNCWPSSTKRSHQSRTRISCIRRIWRNSLCRSYERLPPSPRSPAYRCRMVRRAPAAVTGRCVKNSPVRRLVSMPARTVSVIRR
jgi:hypothetical protein